jgi:hypothetical protein
MGCAEVRLSDVQGYRMEGIMQESDMVLLEGHSGYQCIGCGRLESRRLVNSEKQQL